MSKKILSILLALAMVPATVPLFAFAENDVLSYLTYEINNGEVTITDCDTSISGDVVIPDTIEGYPVTAIGEYAFNYCINIISITIPYSIMIINENAFSACESIKNFTVSENNENYSNDEYGVLFNKEKTELIQYPAGNSRTEYTIPDSVTTIYVGFYGCDNIENINISRSVSRIYPAAFWCCENLKNIAVAEDNEYYSCDEYGVLFNKEKNELIQYPSGNRISEYSIPCGVETIYTAAFAMCNEIQNITVSNSVTTMGEGAFDACKNLEYIKVLNSECSIYDSEYTIYSDATIYGYTDSTAQAYAEKYNRAFIAFDDENVSEEESTEENTTESDDNNNNNDSNKTTFNFTAGEAWVGEEVVITLSAINMVGLESADLVFTYDSEYLEFVSIKECEDATYHMSAGGLPIGKHNTITFSFFWTESAAVDSGLCEITLKVLKPGTSTVSVTCRSWDGTQMPADAAIGITGIEKTPGGEDSSDENMDSTNHSYSEWETVTAASCTENGLKKRVCSTCGEIEIETIEASGHNKEHITIDSTCTVAGMEYDICLTCFETFNSNVLPLADHTFGEWTITVEATFMNEGERTRACSVCGEVETETIPKLVAENEYVNEDTGVSITVSSDTYENDIKVDISYVYDGESFQLINAQIGNVNSAIFDITTTVNGEKVQPNGKVLVKIPVPDGYNVDCIVVYYVPNDGSALVKMDSYIENGYVCFETDHFSEYAIVDTTVIDDSNSESEKPECACNCHTNNTFMKFINKIIFFFRKLFGMTEYRYCTCGAAHW